MADATENEIVRPPLPHRVLSEAERLRIGDMDFAYAEVAHYAFTAETERDWAGQLLCAGLYGAASSLFFIGILIGSLDWKFLIAVTFLGSIAMMSTGDALATRPVTVYRVHMTLADGRKAMFVDGDLRIAQAVVRHIEAARRAVGLSAYAT